MSRFFAEASVPSTPKAGLSSLVGEAWASLRLSFGWGPDLEMQRLLRFLRRLAERLQVDQLPEAKEARRCWGGFFKEIAEKNMFYACFFFGNRLICRFFLGCLRDHHSTCSSFGPF